jgi:MFS transporter, PAT family, solute carrier family 33 (acetyl-CoA transportor), member 1
MVEKGLGREDLAITVLIDFPFQMVGGWLAARWSTPQRPLRPWLWAYAPRLAFAFVSTVLVYYFPTPPISTSFFLFLVVHTVLQSFSSCVFFFAFTCFPEVGPAHSMIGHVTIPSVIKNRTIQFSGISAFHTRISDPVIGGTYMTVSDGPILLCSRHLARSCSRIGTDIFQLLNTFSNLGGTWPRYFVLKGVDYFSVATCQVKESGSQLAIRGT